MKKLVVLGFVSFLLACSQNSPVVKDTQSAAEVSNAPYEKLVGRWQFVYDADRRAAVEAKLASTISDPQKLAEAKKEAAEEAAKSTIEFTQDRVYISRIGDEVIRRGPADAAPKGVTVKLIDSDQTLVMHDPEKGDLVFTRVR